MDARVIQATPPPTQGQGVRRLGVALHMLAAVLIFIGLIIPTVEVPNGDGGDCGAGVAGVLGGDGYSDECRDRARDLATVAVGLVVAGAVAAAAGYVCWRAAQARRRRGWAGAAVAAGRVAVLPLASGVGRARAELSPQSLTMVMPIYFGSVYWTVPLSEITLVDPAAAPTGDAEPAGAAPARPLLLPMFYDAPAFPWRRITLLFRAPQRVPALRRFWGMGSGLSAAMTRSAAGVWIDGMVVSFRDPDEAATAVARAGAPSVPSVRSWAQAHRPLVPDPNGRNPTVRPRPAAQRFQYLGLVLGPAAIFLVVSGRGGLVLAAVYGALGLLALALVRRLYRPRPAT